MIRKIVKEKPEETVMVDNCKLENVFALDPYNLEIFTLASTDHCVWGFVSIMSKDGFNNKTIFTNNIPSAAINHAIDAGWEVFEVESRIDLVNYLNNFIWKSNKWYKTQ